MANTKVTSMPSATSLNATDVFYLVQGAGDKKLSVATLLGTLPNTPAKFTGLVGLGGTPQVIVNTGVVNTTSTLTTISNDTASTLTIADGTIDTQVKLIVCTGASATTTLNAGTCTVSFTTTGHTCFLVWISSNWYVVGGTATVAF